MPIVKYYVNNGKRFKGIELTPDEQHDLCKRNLRLIEAQLRKEPNERTH